LQPSSWLPDAQSQPSSWGGPQGRLEGCFGWRGSLLEHPSRRRWSGSSGWGLVDFSATHWGGPQGRLEGCSRWRGSLLEHPSRRRPSPASQDQGLGTITSDLRGNRSAGGAFRMAGMGARGPSIASSHGKNRFSLSVSGFTYDSPKEVNPW